MLDFGNKKLCELCFNAIEGDTCPHCHSISNSSRYPTALKEGTVLAGKYAVGRVLGKGGFGVTYLCFDLEKGEKVAIKEYFPDSIVFRNVGETTVNQTSTDKDGAYMDGARKFYEEAQTVAKFNTVPNIIHVHEFFYQNNTAYFVMEYLEGIDFKCYIRNNGGKLSPQKALDVISKVADALGVVHSTGILHRDISPDNIFICNNGDIKLIDFGAARFVTGEASKSLSVILKQGFAPLEQYNRKGTQGPWTDIYALGATLYFAITGKVIDDVMTRIEEDGLDLREIPSNLQPVISKMLAVKYADRYQNTSELKAAFVSAITDPERTFKNANKTKEQTDKKEGSLSDTNALDTEPESSNKHTNVIPTKKNKAIPIAIASLFLVIILSVSLVLLLKDDSEDRVSGSVGISENPEVNPEETDDKTSKAEIVASGECGENLTWTLDANGTLTISGNGAMYDWEDETDTPWYSNKASIKQVVINSGVTSIGSSAFAYCESLKSITIPNSVTSIGGGAFAGCTSLTSITIPNSVTSIGDDVFVFCTSLKSITIPNSVTSIGESAFYYCTSLKSITIPNSVTSIGDDAFGNCTSLTSITIPNSVTSIGDDAFGYCTNLKSITIPNSVTSIGSSAFQRWTSNQHIYIKGSTAGWDNYWEFGCDAQIHFEN